MAPALYQSSCPSAHRVLDRLRLSCADGLHHDSNQFGEGAVITAPAKSYQCLQGVGRSLRHRSAANLRHSC